MLSKDIITEVSRAQRERERRERAERDRADQIAAAQAQREREQTINAAQRARKIARVTKQLDPTRQFAPRADEPEFYTFGNVRIPIEKTAAEPTGGYYILFKVIKENSRTYLVAYWLKDSDFEVQIRDNSNGFDSASRLRQTQVIKSVGDLANLLSRLRQQNAALQVIFSREVRTKYPDVDQKIKFFIDNNMDDFVNYEDSR